jgi:hypothetical protein
MCKLCNTKSSDPAKRLKDIATLLSKKAITQAHADNLINVALGIEEAPRDRDAEAAWERSYRRGRQ